jgi:hypothetical protein
MTPVSLRKFCSGDGPAIDVAAGAGSHKHRPEQPNARSCRSHCAVLDMRARLLPIGEDASVARRTNQARVWLIATGALALIMVANWIGITVHINNLRTSAAHSSGDAAPQLLAEADDFRAAQALFGLGAVVLSIILFALAVHLLRRR